MTAKEIRQAALTADAALIVRLRWNFLEGTKIDREQTSIVSENTGAELQALNVTKKLFAPSVLADIRSLKNESQKILKLMTHPWDDQGGRVLPTKAFSSFQEKFLSIDDRLDQAVQRIIDNYDSIKEESAIRLNSLFNENEFPSKESIREKFAVRIEYTPIPKEEHIILEGVSDAEQDQIKKDIESTVGSKMAEAHRNNYLRLMEVVEKLFSRLGNTSEGKPEVFHQSTVENLKEVVSTARMMNFQDDSALESLIDNLEHGCDIENLNAEDLRADPKLRFGVRANLKGAVEDIKSLGIL